MPEIRLGESHVGGSVCPPKVPLEAVDGLEIGLDRPRRQIAGAKMAPKRRQDDFQIPYTVLRDMWGRRHGTSPKVMGSMSVVRGGDMTFPQVSAGT
jgi:hypothetical protein